MVPEAWSEAWQTLEQHPASALRLLEQFAPKRGKPPKAPKKRQRYLQARYGQAICYLRLSRLDEAESSLRDVVTYKPSPTELAQLCQAWLLASKENVRPAAVDAWAKLLALPVESVPPQVRGEVEAALVAQLQLQPADTRERCEQRLALADRVIQTAGQWGPAFRERGLLLARLQRWPEAITALDQALAIHPGQIDVLRTLAEALRTTGDKPRLRDTLLAVHGLQPTAAGAYETALLFLEIAGDAPPTTPPAGTTDFLAEAQTLLESAVQLDPQMAQAWLALSRVQWRRGQRGGNPIGRAGARARCR